MGPINQKSTNAEFGYWGNAWGATPVGKMPKDLPWWMSTDAGQRMTAYANRAQPLLEQSTLGAYNQQASTMARGFRDTQRQSGDQMAMYGINPAAVFGHLQPQQSMGLAEQFGGMRGGAEAQLAQGQLDLGGQVTNALNQIEAYYDSIGLQKYAADKGYAAAKKGAQGAMIGSGLGMIGSIGMGMAMASDLRLKKNVRTIGRIGRVRLVRWDWNERGEALGLHGSSAGVIAQELQAVRPELVVVQPTGFLSVNYAGL